ncbi:MAG: hypothetical protein Q4C93_03535 [Clostridia bacterium]|nr:hypothetical protein [Clostridia bacterium]
MFNRLIEWKKLRGVLAFAAYMIFAMFIQSLLFSRVSIFGYRGFILPAAAVAAGIYSDGVRGAVFGLILGLFADMSFSESVVTFTVLFPIIGFAAGVASMFYINKSFFAFITFSAAAILLTALVQMLLAVIVSGAEILPALITALAQTAVSLIPAALLYLPFRHK